MRRGGGAAARAGAALGARQPADPRSARRRLTRRPSPARAPAQLHPPNQEVNRRRKCLLGRRGSRVLRGPVSLATDRKEWSHRGGLGKGALRAERVLEKNVDIARPAWHNGKGSSAQPRGWTTTPRMPLEERNADGGGLFGFEGS